MAILIANNERHGHQADQLGAIVRESVETHHRVYRVTQRTSAQRPRGMPGG
jgi:hypothetical protein